VFEIAKFSSPWQQGRSFVNFNEAVKLRADEKTPYLMQDFGHSSGQKACIK